MLSSTWPSMRKAKRVKKLVTKPVQHHPLRLLAWPLLMQGYELAPCFPLPTGTFSLSSLWPDWCGTSGHQGFEALEPCSRPQAWNSTPEVDLSAVWLLCLWGCSSPALLPTEVQGWPWPQLQKLLRLQVFQFGLSTLELEPLNESGMLSNPPCVK